MLRELLHIFRPGNPLSEISERFAEMLRLTRDMTQVAGRYFLGSSVTPEERDGIYRSDVRVNKLERKIRKRVVTNLSLAFIRQGRGYARRCDDLLTRIAGSPYPPGLTTVVVLGARYYKRIGGHLMNVLSSVVMPLHKVDYYDEDEVPAPE